MIKVNLLSPEKKDIPGGESRSFADESQPKKINIVAALFAGVLTVGLIGYLYFTTSSETDEKEKALEIAKAKKVELDGILKQLEELDKAKSLLEKKAAIIEELKSQQQDTVKMMDQLSNALPDWVWLESLTFSGKLVNITGKAIHNNLISDFINNLKGTGSFDNVQFPGSNRQTQGGLDIFNFSLSFMYQDKDKAKKEEEKDSKESKDSMANKKKG